MNGFWYGIFGFGAIVLSDINIRMRNNDRLETLYAVGAGLIGLGCFNQAMAAKAVLAGWLRIVTGVLGLCALFGIIYCLFIAGKRVRWGRAERENKRNWWERPLVNTGVYALCRHPALWCHWVFMLCLNAATGFPMLYTTSYCIAGFLVVWYEDVKAFPQTIPGYDKYKKTTPFLFPNRGSVSRCKASWGQRSAKK